MKSLAIWVIVLASLLATGKYALARHEDGASVRTAQRRVEGVFGAMKSGTGAGADLQTAICLWAENKIFIADRDALGRYSDQFDNWREAKKLYRAFDSFEIKSVERLDPEKPEPVVVTVTVDGGTPLEILVETGASLRWGK